MKISGYDPGLHAVTNRIKISSNDPCYDTLGGRGGLLKKEE